MTNKYEKSLYLSQSLLPEMTDVYPLYAYMYVQ